MIKKKEIHMIARIANSTLALILFATVVYTQQPAAPAKPAPTPKPTVPTAIEPAAAPTQRSQPINVRVEVTITEQRGKTGPSKKLLSIVAADGFRNAIRSQETFFPPVDRGVGDVPLNVDVVATVLGGDGKIRLQLNLEYELPGDEIKKDASGEFARTMTKSAIRENLVMILENGRPMIVAQSADPVSDRQVTVEVRATILK
jgi:hypothetical protein